MTPNPTPDTSAAIARLRTLAEQQQANAASPIEQAKAPLLADIAARIEPNAIAVTKWSASADVAGNVQQMRSVESVIASTTYARRKWAEFSRELGLFDVRVRRSIEAPGTGREQIDRLTPAHGPADVADVAFWLRHCSTPLAELCDQWLTLCRQFNDICASAERELASTVPQPIEHPHPAAGHVSAPHGIPLPGSKKAEPELFPPLSGGA